MLNFERGRSMRLAGLSSLVVAMGLTACATQVPMPPNVRLVEGAYGAVYINQVDFSYDTPAPMPFGRVKLCVAEHVGNSEVQLSDTAGSFVGAATGTYYQANNRQTSSGGSVFKYADDSAATLIATGGTRTAGSSLGLVIDYVRYDLKAASTARGVTLVFSNITRAQQNTGLIANRGFEPVGVSPGARAPGVYAALEATAQKLKTCLN
ncbi:MAG TPA: hypothetical protein VFR90_11525 [Methylibium sp.]|uniref:hypothetical protein n=1 Tax=Methylibium sp. TaxID=2067992 RepID=UPI002DBA1E5E|nr:hypothetical protein [Methylibium sp.]HEU4459743.1 hypothetical protein [Methylibium sp.]